MLTEDLGGDGTFSLFIYESKQVTKIRVFILQIILLGDDLYYFFSFQTRKEEPNLLTIYWWLFSSCFTLRERLAIATNRSSLAMRR